MFFFLSQPTILIPERLSDSGITVVQLDMDTLFVSNDNDIVQMYESFVFFFFENFLNMFVMLCRSMATRRTDVFVSRAQVLLEVIALDLPAVEPQQYVFRLRFFNAFCFVVPIHR